MQPLPPAANFLFDRNLLWVENRDQPVGCLGGFVLDKLLILWMYCLFSFHLCARFFGEEELSFLLHTHWVTVSVSRDVGATLISAIEKHQRNILFLIADKFGESSSISIQIKF
jgi:hypothetical protein